MFSAASFPFEEKAETCAAPAGKRTDETERAARLVNTA
jgi:hypothetical protein